MISVFSLVFRVSEAQDQMRGFGKSSWSLPYATRSESQDRAWESQILIIGGL